MTQDAEGLPWDKDVQASIPPPAQHKANGVLKAAITVLVLVALLLWWLFRQGIIALPSRPAYRGLSSGLRQTAIVPTLDSPLPAQRNVLWCSSLQLAWNEARVNIFQAPIQLKKDPSLARQLNNAPSSMADLAPEDGYAAAGFYADGILEKIRQDMARKFPDVPHTDMPPANSEGLVMYAYLAAQAKFTVPFHNNRAKLHFVDSAGRSTAVRSFGVLPNDKSNYYAMREQVKVLYRNDYLTDEPSSMKEFALDLCKTSQPYQIVLASVPPKATLAATWKDVQEKIAFMPKPSQHKPDTLGSNDLLLIPEMRWSITHRFAELEGNTILNAPGGPLLQVVQRIDFRLDRNGAELKSPAWITMGCSQQTRYQFNRPYLLYLTRRGAKTPCFVMWVDNAELMNK